MPGTTRLEVATRKGTRLRPASLIHRDPARGCTLVGGEPTERLAGGIDHALVREAIAGQRVVRRGREQHRVLSRDQRQAGVDRIEALDPAAIALRHALEPADGAAA